MDFSLLRIAPFCRTVGAYLSLRMIIIALSLTLLLLKNNVSATSLMLQWYLGARARIFVLGIFELLCPDV